MMRTRTGMSCASRNGSWRSSSAAHVEPPASTRGCQMKAPHDGLPGFRHLFRHSPGKPAAGGPRMARSGLAPGTHDFQNCCLEDSRRSAVGIRTRTQSECGLSTDFGRSWVVSRFKSWRLDQPIPVRRYRGPCASCHRRVTACSFRRSRRVFRRPPRPRPHGRRPPSHRGGHRRCRIRGRKRA